MKKRAAREALAADERASANLQRNVPRDESNAARQHGPATGSDDDQLLTTVGDLDPTTFLGRGESGRISGTQDIVPGVPTFVDLS